MKEFILKDSFIDSIYKHKQKLNDFYEKEINNMYFNSLGYKNYFMSLIYPKEKRFDNWRDLIENSGIFREIFEENPSIIIPTIDIGRLIPFENREWFISHKHLFKEDLRLYHYVVKCNDKCGMIIRNEFLHYYPELAFSFNANRPHITFNFGNTMKDSFVFIVLNPKYSLKEWYEKRVESAMSNKYMLKEMNKQYAKRQIKKFVHF